MNDSTQAPIISVVRVTVSIQPKIEAAATISSTTDVVSIVSIETLTSIFQLSVRNQKMPRKSAQTHAAIAPSVAVKMPAVMPPISSTGVMIGSTALKRNMRSANSSSASAAATVATSGKPPLCVSSQITIGNAATTASSVRALAMRRSSKRVSPPHLFLCAK